MFKLIKLELIKNNLKSYILSIVVITLIMLGFLYLFAYVPKIDSDPELQVFAGYNNIIPLFSVLNMAVYATFSAVISSRFIIEEYKDKRLILLLSYPTKRQHIMIAKIIVIFIFTFTAMILSSLIAFSVFSTSEFFIPIAEGTLDMPIFLKFITSTISMSITAASIGIIASGIGFIKKSIATTIISAVLISSLICNVTFNMANNSKIWRAITILPTFFMIMIAIIIAIFLARKTQKMEVL